MSSFTCALCAETVEIDDTVWSEEDAISEFESTYGKPFPGYEHVEMLCDECYYMESAIEDFIDILCEDISCKAPLSA